MAYKPPKVKLSPRVVKYVCIYLSVMFFPAVIMMFVIKADMLGFF